MAVNPIPAFNGRLNLQTAFGYNVVQIQQFLNDVAANPDNYRERDPANPTQPYPDPNPQRRLDRIADLALLRDEIIALTPSDGAKYIAPAPPRQSILRQAKGVTLNPTRQIPWTINDRKEHFYLIFDLLGVFLSLIGPAPTINTTTPPPPTNQNYFLPLVVVYAKWCSTLTGVESGFTPAVAQITWARKDNGPWFYLLGASAKGWTQEKQWEKLWRVLAQKTRYEYVHGRLENEFAWNSSPAFTARGARAGWNFGNCAETYPFLYLIREGYAANNIFGIAIDIAYTTELGVRWADYPIKPPCENCDYVIKKFYPNGLEGSVAPGPGEEASGVSTGEAGGKIEQT